MSLTSFTSLGYGTNITGRVKNSVDALVEGKTPLLNLGFSNTTDVIKRSTGGDFSISSGVLMLNTSTNVSLNQTLMASIPSLLNKTIIVDMKWGNLENQSSYVLYGANSTGGNGIFIRREFVPFNQESRLRNYTSLNWTSTNAQIGTGYNRILSSLSTSYLTHVISIDNSGISKHAFQDELSATFDSDSYSTISSPAIANNQNFIGFISGNKSVTYVRNLRIYGEALL